MQTEFEAVERRRSYLFIIFIIYSPQTELRKMSGIQFNETNISTSQIGQLKLSRCSPSPSLTRAFSLSIPHDFNESVPNNRCDR